MDFALRFTKSLNSLKNCFLFIMIKVYHINLLGYDGIGINLSTGRKNGTPARGLPELAPARHRVLEGGISRAGRLWRWCLLREYFMYPKRGKGWRVSVYTPLGVYTPCSSIRPTGHDQKRVFGFVDSSTYRATNLKKRADSWLTTGKFGFVRRVEKRG